MRKRAVFVLCILLALLSSCIPAGKTLEDYMPKPADSALFLPAEQPPPIALVPAAAELLSVDTNDAPESGSPEPALKSLFEDSAYEAAVREYLAKPTGEITIQDLASIERLAVTTQAMQNEIANETLCVVYEAESLDDLGLFSEVDTLLLDGFNHFSLSPAAYLPLKWLEIWNCVDFEGLGVLAERSSDSKYLEFLGIFGCAQFEDLTSLSEFKDLATFECINACVSDLTPLSTLYNLTQLNLHGNRIRDISPIGSLFRLQTLNVSGNYVTDLAPLKNMTALKTLQLTGNRIQDLKPLQSLKLQNLFLDLNEITSIAPLSSLTDVETLDISFNPIKNLSTLPRMGALRSLGVEGLPPTLLKYLLRVKTLDYVFLSADQAEVWRTRLEQNGVTVDIEDTPSAALPDA